MIITPTASVATSTALSSKTVMAASASMTPISVTSTPPDNTTGLEKAVKQLNQSFTSIGIELDIHDDSGRVVTRVIDRESGDVIRQMPTEEVLHMARLATYQKGRLLQTTA
ncbi:flagellar protein FlaG [Kushneria sp. Sum13]|uniref:flagellar protein FlaG n=1 Tax=Kushneria sp. Sum13 TaxID=3459196 RepID=UPI0040453A2F